MGVGWFGNLGFCHCLRRCAHPSFSAAVAASFLLQRGSWNNLRNWYTPAMWLVATCPLRLRMAKRSNLYIPIFSLQEVGGCNCWGLDGRRDVGDGEMWIRIDGG